MRLASLKTQAEEEPAASDETAHRTGGRGKTSRRNACGRRAGGDKPADASAESRPMSQQQKRTHPPPKLRSPPTPNTGGRSRSGARRRSTGRAALRAAGKSEDQIRDSLPVRRRPSGSSEIFDELSGADAAAMPSERRHLRHARQKDDTIKPPKPFPFAELAKKYGIEAAEAAAGDRRRSRGRGPGQGGAHRAAIALAIWLSQRTVRSSSPSPTACPRTRPQSCRTTRAMAICSGRPRSKSRVRAQVRRRCTTRSWRPGR